MTELWLKFTDEYGEERRILVERDDFTVGRHSGNDLCIANGKLSREHIKIERFADVFIVSDRGSSNGTTLNGADLTDSISLQDGDVLNLGGGLEIEVKVSSSTNEDANNTVGATAANSENNINASSEAGTSGVSTSSAASSSGGGGSIPTIFYYIAPAFVLVVLLLGGGLFLAFSDGKKQETSGGRGDDFTYTKNTPTEEDLPKNKKDKDSNKATPPPQQQPSPSSSTDVPANNQISDPSGSQQTTVTISSDIEKVKQNSTAFMRRIAQNDQNPFLTQEQANLVNEKIKAVKNFPALVENIKAVKKDASQFETLATSSFLKPQFLATAALTGLGGERGSPTERAKQMLPILSKLKVNLDSKLADDNLLIIAAYEQGKAGKYDSLTGKMEGLAKKLKNVSPRQIRSIWFLKEKGKITDAEFDFALRFLAIGTIMQNPTDFGVQTEAVTF